MMPYCQYGICKKVAVFLGPNELPAACARHLAELEQEIDSYHKTRSPVEEDKPNEK